MKDSHKPDVVMERGDAILVHVDSLEDAREFVINNAPVWDAFSKRFRLDLVSKEEWNRRQNGIEFGEAQGQPEPELKSRDSIFNRTAESRVRRLRQIEDENSVNQMAKQLVGSAPGMSHFPITALKLLCKHDVANHRIAQDIKRIQSFLEFDRGWLGNIEKRIAHFERHDDAGRKILEMLAALERLMESADSDRTVLKNEIDVLKKRVDDIVSSPAWNQMGMLPHRVKTLEGQIGARRRKKGK